MKHPLFAFLCFTLAFAPGYAQHTPDAPLPDDTKVYHLGLQLQYQGNLHHQGAGIGFIVEQCARFGFRTGLSFQMQSSDLYLQQFLQRGEPETGDHWWDKVGEERFSQLHYVSVPLMLTYNLNERIQFTAGVRLAFNTGSRSIYTSYWNGQVHEVNPIKGSSMDILPPFDLGGEFGTNVKIAPGLFAELQYHHGIIPITYQNHNPEIGYVQETPNRFRQYVQVGLLWYPFHFGYSQQAKKSYWFR